MEIRKLGVQRIRKCGCGRAILSIRTSKAKKNNSSVSPEKNSSVVSTIQSLTPFSRKVDSSSEEETSSKETVQTGRTSSGSTDVKTLCGKCQKMNSMPTTITIGEDASQPKKKKNVATNKRRKLPIIERLRIVKVSSASISEERSRRRKCRHKRNSETTVGPPPTEVFIEHSQLGFDGISPSSTMPLKVPTRFTFDDVIPSNSSIATTELAENMPSHHLTKKKSTVIACSGTGKTSFDKSIRDTELQQFATFDTAHGHRERGLTDSTIDTEMDINDKFDSCTTANDSTHDKNKAFPVNAVNPNMRATTMPGEEKAPQLGNGGDAGNEEEQTPLGWLFGFSNLAIN